jgi:hypothetical protein
MKTNLLRNHWLFATAVAMTLSCSANAQTADLSLVPQVDPRVELLSIVFHLAGNEEYNVGALKNYTSDIESYFGPYKVHPAIALAKKLASEDDIGFDAPMAIAVHLSDPPDLTPLVPIGQFPVGWKENGGQFLKLLRDFSRDTNFPAFFAAHRPLYQLAESRFRDIVSSVDLTWYPKFY